MGFSVRTSVDINKTEAVISPRNAGKFLLYSTGVIKLYSTQLPPLKPHNSYKILTIFMLLKDAILRCTCLRSRAYVKSRKIFLYLQRLIWSSLQNDVT
jgi:hypothetical protein